MPQRVKNNCGELIHLWRSRSPNKFKGYIQKLCPKIGGEVMCGEQRDPTVRKVYLDDIIFSLVVFLPMNYINVSFIAEV